MLNFHNDPLLVELQQWVTATLCGDHPTTISTDARQIVHRHAQAPAHHSGEPAPAAGSSTNLPQADRV
jgi:hypothetical protein